MSGEQRTENGELGGAGGGYDGVVPSVGELVVADGVKVGGVVGGVDEESEVEEAVASLSGELRTENGELGGAGGGYDGVVPDVGELVVAEGDGVEGLVGGFYVELHSDDAVGAVGGGIDDGDAQGVAVGEGDAVPDERQ